MGANMENIAHGNVPEYGAIFMSNSMTRAECFKRKLFGLPYWLGDFVLRIKSGMILFLFEYEKRVLHGVFQAVSDGAMNIVPNAYSSSAQQFPAQVKFSILWFCNPLSEDLFQNAIKENYFSAKKFNFGLSGVQVHRLLSLFSLTKFNDQLHLRQLSSELFKCSSDYSIGESVADGNGLILNGRSQGRVMEDEDQVNTMQESATLSHYNIRNIIPSTDNPVHCLHMDTRKLTRGSGCLSSAQSTMPSLHSQSDCMTSIPSQMSVNLENITIPSVTQSHIHVTCSDPNLLTLPTRELENDGSLRRSIITSEYLSNGLNDFIFPYQNEQGLARPENAVMYAPETKEFPSQLPFDSVVVSSMPAIEHTAANPGQECSGSSGSMHSDRERKRSVFSRLSYPSDASIQEFKGFGHEMLFLDPSIDEVMSILQRHRWQWKKTNCEVPRPKCNAGRNFVKKKRTRSSLSSYSNCFQVSDEHGANNEGSIDSNSNHNAIGIPFVNFKRRRKQCKVEDYAATGEGNVNVGIVQLLGVQQKRRKLIRPRFVYSELHDSGDTNSVPPSLPGMTKYSHFRGKANINHRIGTDKTQKLCPAVVLPDIIWLVDDEDKDIGIETDDEDKNIGIETLPTSEDCCGGSNRNSEDRIASSNYISDSNLNVTSKDLVINESCRSTHNCSTSENHTNFQNLNNSGLCRQELSLEDSEVNAGNCFKRFNEGDTKCNAKELNENVRIVEPFQGFLAVIESSGKSSSPLNSASESTPEEVIERRKNNENGESRDLELNYDSGRCF